MSATNYRQIGKMSGLWDPAYLSVLVTRHVVGVETQLATSTDELRPEIAMAASES